MANTDSLTTSPRTAGSAEADRREGLAVAVRQLLLSRGIKVSEGFPADVPGFADATEAELIVRLRAC